ncbi:hypothetical protein CEXT_426381, partial [Caerostris extrusa]
LSAGSQASDDRKHRSLLSSPFCYRTFLSVVSPADDILFAPPLLPSPFCRKHFRMPQR